MYCVIQNTPNALTRAGMMMAPRVPVQPISLNRMYSGTTPSCIGTAIVAMTKTSRTLEPLNRSFAKAQPARVEKNTTDRAMSAELTIEFHSATQKFTAGSLITFAALLKKFPPGSHDMLGSRIVYEVPDPISSDQ